jgi:hypothetical protein
VTPADIVLMPWHTGTGVLAIFVYAMIGDAPSDGDPCIARFHSESVAAIAVLNHNDAVKNRVEHFIEPTK